MDPTEEAKKNGKSALEGKNKMTVQATVRKSGGRL